MRINTEFWEQSNELYVRTVIEQTLLFRLAVGREPRENMNNPQLWTKTLIILVMNTRYLNGLLNYSSYLFPGRSRSQVDCVA